MMLNFKDRLLLGLCTVDAIEDEIAAWHEGAGQGQKLHEYLGFTQSEYGAWLKTGLDATLLAAATAQRVARNFQLYQVNLNTSDGLQLAFRPLPADHGNCPPVRADVYWQVYAGTILCGVDWPDQKVAERLFHIFNVQRPKDFIARSLSVSDVVALYGSEKERFYFCDSFRFIQVAFDSKAASPKEITNHD